jgi:hypothetical protein
VAYAKGTDVQKPRTLANPSDSETSLLMAMYAAQGYAVVASDYLGFAKSTYSYHPYLHADSEATTVIDSIRAARAAAAATGVTLSGKVMLTGYSQGGHSSMAAHRAIERDIPGEINVVAGAHLAGPYNLSGSLKLPDAIAGVPVLRALPRDVLAKGLRQHLQQRGRGFQGALCRLHREPAAQPDAELHHAGHHRRAAGRRHAQPGPRRPVPVRVPGRCPNQCEQPPVPGRQKERPARLEPQGAHAAVRRRGRPDRAACRAHERGPGRLHSRGLSNVTSVDVDPFVQATYGIAGKAPTDPTSAAFATYYGSYHGTYEPPFCHAQARAVFDTLK